MYPSVIFLAISFVSLNADKYLLVEVGENVEPDPERDILSPGNPGPATIPKDSKFLMPNSKDKNSGYRHGWGHRRSGWWDELKTTPTTSPPPGMNIIKKRRLLITQSR